MPPVAKLSLAERRAMLERARADYNAFKARGLKLDMTRGKPAAGQLDLANGMLALPGNGDYVSDAGEDGRNYGNQQGLAETRKLFAGMVGAPADQIVVGDNSSLAIMHDTVVWALLKGVPGGNGPWAKEGWGQDGPVAFICPVPGYDRHFHILEEFGIRLLPVPLTGQGPDMDLVEELAKDPSVKGMWCVPKYSNPSGDVYSPETVERLAAMKTGAADFRLFWDNAYSVHHLTAKRHAIPDILEACAAAGHPDRAFIFASTSKVTLAGAGIAFFASSPANVKWYLARASKRTIGPDKLNQLRHVRFLRDHAGIEAHMEKHRALIAPKFAAVEKALEDRLGGLGLATWAKPEGGYFVSVDCPEGTATRVVELCKEAGLALTPAGATWPGGKDPKNSNLRLAPTVPNLADVTLASEGIALCMLVAGLEAAVADHR